MEDAAKSQRIKLGVGVGLLVVAALVYFFYGRSPSGLPTDINFIDVTTGASFKIDRDDIREIPMPNPKTGQKTLLPCIVADGKVRIDPHYRTVLDLIKGDKRVDPSTLEVKMP